MKEFDIFNNQQRAVVCVKCPTEDVYFPNASKLKIGEIYHVIRVTVYNWNTWVYLEEFPGIKFNSVQFNELDD